MTADPYPSIKVCDFGLSKIVEDGVAQTDVVSWALPYIQPSLAPQCIEHTENHPVVWLRMVYCLTVTVTVTWFRT